MRRAPCVIATVVLLIASGCGGGNDTASRQGGVEARPLALDQQILTVGALADDYNARPERPDLGKYPLNTSIFDTLTRMNEDLQVEPMLAERWDFDEASNTYRYFLRQGVKFHDGSELTADDVKYTVDFLAAGQPNNYQAIGPDSVKVVDRYTVAITPTRKNNRLIEQLVHPTWGINRKDSDPLKPIGTGPYKLVEYVQDDRLVVERFEEYWNPERAAAANRVTFRFVADPQTKILALRSGELDVIMDVPRDAASELEADPGIKVVRSKTGAYNAINFNIAGTPPYDLGKDRAIRQAVAFAIDRKAVLDKVWGGNAEESTTWLPPAVLGPHATMINAVAHDAQRANEVLDEAGWERGPDGIRARDGRRLTLVHLIGGPGDTDPRDSVPAAEVIQDQLKQVGIETKIEVPEQAVSQARLNDGQYDMFQGTGNQNEANPCFLPDFVYHSKSSFAAAKFRAPGGKTDEAIERCRSATTIDGVRRAAAEAVHQLVDVEHVIIPLIGLYRIWAMKENVTGFEPHPSLTNQRWETVHLVSQ